MVEQDHDLIKELVRAQWANDMELPKHFMASVSEQTLRHVYMEIDQVIT